MPRLAFVVALGVSSLVCGGGTSSAKAGAVSAQECTSAAGGLRRQQAIEFARRLNAEQHRGFPGAAGQRYRPLSELRNLPPVPEGFRLQFHTDGRSYGFSLKDMRDTCGFAIFSDQDGEIYAALPQPRGSVVVPLESQ